MARETVLAPDNLILPLFVSSEPDANYPISSLPGCHVLSGKPLLRFARKVRDEGVAAVLLFAIVDPGEKDMLASIAGSRDGPVARAICELKGAVPELGVIADLCLCEYKSDGQCGILSEGQVDNDATLNRIHDISAVFARAGADVIAPSGMMDGMVRAIRNSLDSNGYQNTMTMPYSAKFHSAFYDPFKDGTDSNPETKLHGTHQMDAANGQEAMREIALDIEEGADMVIIKPALPSLDVIRDARENFSVPIAAYQVSGEAAMIHAAGQEGYLNADAVLMESLLSIRRAGADMIITYLALDAVRML